MSWEETDVERWRKVARTAPTWLDRNRKIAQLIRPGSSVLYIGAGNMNIREFLRENCTYQPMDCFRSSGGTILADFNRRQLPPLEGIYDYAVCSGVIEYLDDPAWATTPFCGGPRF